MSAQHTVLSFGNRVYRIFPDMGLVCDIEDELGGVAGLAEKFSGQQWKVSELASLIHMMLQSAGQSVDYRLLGNRMMTEGLAPYAAAAQNFLKQILGGGA